MKFVKNYFLLAIVSLPGLVLAIDFKAFVGNLIGQLQALPSFLIGLAVVYLLWNIVQYISSGDAKQMAEARKTITWSLIFIFVMVSVWGLVALIQETFNLGGSSNSDRMEFFNSNPSF